MNLGRFILTDFIIEMLAPKKIYSVTIHFFFIFRILMFKIILESLHAECNDQLHS
jgi:hypothetical protein